MVCGQHFTGNRPRQFAIQSQLLRAIMDARGYVCTDATDQVLLITLSRVRKLNALSKSMIHALHPVVAGAVARGQKLIFRGAGPHFCCGGDIIHMYLNPPHGNRYLRVEYQLFMRIADYVNTKVAIMKGFTLGSGAGFAYLSNIRIATETTQWGFPECANGSLPDLGATYILNHISAPGVGLYLSLTGSRVSGADCYQLGIATHYVPTSAKADEMLKEMMATGRLLEAAERFHCEPETQHCPVFAAVPAIARCFHDVKSVEEVVARLSADTDKPWAEKTLRTLRDNCPYVVKIAYECLLSSSALSYSECMRVEFVRDCNIYDKRYRNYHIGITHKFMEKRTGRPQWQPDCLESVTPEMVGEFLSDSAFPPLPHYDSLEPETAI